jgi:hypothetical protein
MNIHQKDKKAQESYQKRVLACKQKHRYSDEITARAAAMDSIQKYKNVEKLYVYNCPVCSGWHLTKTGKDIAITEKNPFDEKLAAYEDFLSIIKTGPITTVSENSQNSTEQDIWLYNLCLELEEKNKIYRFKTKGDKIQWKYNSIKTRQNKNKETVVLIAA